MSEQLDFALNLVNEFSAPAEAGAKSALALASAILQAEKAEQALQKSMDKGDQVGALAAKLSKAASEHKIAALNAPKANPFLDAKGDPFGAARGKLADGPLSGSTSAKIGALLGGSPTAAHIERANAILKVELAQRALNKAQAAGDPARIAQSQISLAQAQLALNGTTEKGTKSAIDYGAALAAVAKGAVAAASAIAGLVSAGAVFALVQADQKRNLQLNLEAMLGSEEAGIAMEEQFQSLSKSLPITRDALDDMGKSLISAGLRGAELTRTIETLATVESTMGAEGANKLRNMIEKWNIVGHFEAPPAKALIGTGVTLDMLYKTLAEKTGQSVNQIKALIKAGKVTTEQGIDALNAAINNKLGNVAAKKMLGVGVQFAKFKENVGNLFEDALGDNFEKFRGALHDLLMLFDSDTESGKTLKFLIDQLFSGIGESSISAMGAIKEIIQGIEIALLEAYIASKPLRETWNELFGGEMSWTSLGEAIGATIGYVAEFISLVIMGAELAGEVIGAVIFAITDTWANISAWWDTLSFEDMGMAIVDGIVRGVESAAGRLMDSVANLGKSALGAFGISIDAHSPSEAFKEYGRFMGEGTAIGVDQSAGMVNDSVSSMVSPPAVQSAGGARGPVSVSLHFDLGGAKAEDAQAIADAVIAKVTSALESIGLSMGEGAPAT